MRPLNITTHKGLPVCLTAGPYELFPESIRHYIMNTWVRHHVHFCSAGDWKAAKAVKDRLRSRFNAILAQPSTIVSVAAFPRKERDEEDRVIGWVIRGPRPVIHYLYTRHAYRSGGAAHLLLSTCMRGDSPFFLATHWAKNLPKNGVYREEESGLEIHYCGFDPLRR